MQLILFTVVWLWSELECDRPTLCQGDLYGDCSKKNKKMFWQKNHRLLTWRLAATCRRAKGRVWPWNATRQDGRHPWSNGCGWLESCCLLVDVNISYVVVVVLCLLPGPLLASQFLPSQFILLHFVFAPKPFQTTTAKCLELWNVFDLWFNELCFTLI